MVHSTHHCTVAGLQVTSAGTPQKHPPSPSIASCGIAHSPCSRGPTMRRGRREGEREGEVEGEGGAGTGEGEG